MSIIVNNSLNGWTIEQWAIALNRFPITDPKDWISVYYQWISRYDYEPGEISIVGVDQEYDFDMAEKVFLHAVSTLSYSI